MSGTCVCGHMESEHGIGGCEHLTNYERVRVTERCKCTHFVEIPARARNSNAGAVKPREIGRCGTCVHAGCWSSEKQNGQRTAVCMRYPPSPDGARPTVDTYDRCGEHSETRA